MTFTKYILTNATPAFRPKGTLFDVKRPRSPALTPRTEAIIGKLIEAFGEPITYGSGHSPKNTAITVNTWFLNRGDYSTVISLTSEGQMGHLILTSPGIGYKDVIPCQDYEI